MSGVTYVDHVPLGTEISGRMTDAGPLLDFGGVRIALGSHPDQAKWLSRLMEETAYLLNEVESRGVAR